MTAVHSPEPLDNAPNGSIDAKRTFPTTAGTTFPRQTNPSSPTELHHLKSSIVCRRGAVEASTCLYREYQVRTIAGCGEHTCHWRGGVHVCEQHGHLTVAGCATDPLHLQLTPNVHAEPAGLSVTWYLRILTTTSSRSTSWTTARP